jgi:esterase/lipase superfamily enzyme
MNREYHKWTSRGLGREMELLVFGHAGTALLAFHTSGGRFCEFEDWGVIAAVREKIDAGQLHLFCVDSVNEESWYNRQAPTWQRMVQRYL